LVLLFAIEFGRAPPRLPVFRRLNLSIDVYVNDYENYTIQAAENGAINPAKIKVKLKQMVLGGE
jgi:hypothetical protein